MDFDTLVEASLTTGVVNQWVRAQSAKLQAMYDLLYVHGYTQREAAATMGVTQARVAQLHRALLMRGRIELGDLVA